jgi:hypothetical protein
MNALRKEKYFRDILEMQEEIVSENMLGIECLTTRASSGMLDLSKTPEEYGVREMQFKKGEW